MNKKGQNMTIGTIIAIVLGIFVLVFLIIGFTQGWNIFTRGLNVFPGDLNVAVKSCSTYAQSDDLIISYCEFKSYEIEGKEGYFNCPYIYKVAEEVSPGSAGFSSKTCGKDGEDGAEDYCISLMERDANNWENTIVNGKKCFDDDPATEDWGITESSTTKTVSP